MKISKNAMGNIVAEAAELMNIFLVDNSEFRATIGAIIEYCQSGKLPAQHARIKPDFWTWIKAKIDKIAERTERARLRKEMKEEAAKSSKHPERSKPSKPSESSESSEVTGAFKDSKRSENSESSECSGISKYPGAPSFRRHGIVLSKRESALG